LTTFPKPRVVISKCIGFEPCRYNGQIVLDDFVPRLEPHVEFVCICPEVEIGLGTPRAPVRVVSSKGSFKLIQPESGLDLTEKMRSFSSGFLNALGEIDGFILKNRSPSCGIGDVKFYAGPEKSAALGRTSGFFGAAVLERFGDRAVEDEGRLNHLGIREHFLTRIFAFARFRDVRRSESIHDLVRFHAANKLLLMACNQTKLRELGRIVANQDGKQTSAVLELYRHSFHDAFRKPPRHASPVNVLMHALGYFKKELSPREKRHFLNVLEMYRLGTAPLSSAVSIIRSWIVRFEIDYLQEQTFFDPFPEELMAADHASRERAIQARDKSV
jgi:uncharacterized protein YbgA (DUF1722 family)/uncharacterized protein YbbK (DUF523 family)